MKKKVMKTWFVVLFIIGLVVGWLVPGDINMFVKKVSGPMLKHDVFDVSKKFGQLVAIPAGVPHSFERIGDAPVEIIVFSTPPFKPNDTVFLENK